MPLPRLEPGTPHHSQLVTYDELDHSAMGPDVCIESEYFVVDMHVRSVHMCTSVR